MRIDTARPSDPAPAADVPKKPRKKCSNPARPYSKQSGRWISGNQAVQLLDIGWTAWRKVLATAEIKVRQLPGQKHPQYSRADLERIAAESERIARPKNA